MHVPREPPPPPTHTHLTVVKCIVRYLQGTIDHDLLFRCAPTSELVYTDADWAGCLDTCRSASGCMVFLGYNLLSLSLKRQNVVSHSSVEQGTTSWPMTWRRHGGSVSIFRSYTTPYRGLPLSTATTLAQFTSPPTHPSSTYKAC
jgi:hypothetical protein